MSVLEQRVVLYGTLDRSGPQLDKFLTARRFRVYSVGAEEDLLDVVEFSQPDVVLLLGVPHPPTLTRLIHAHRASGRGLLALLWPGAHADDLVEMLDSGVDYVANTFQPDLLAAQLRAYLRRIGRERSAPRVIDLGYLLIDLEGRTVNIDGRDVPLTRTEFDVLRVLAERPGTVLPSGEIMQQVMGVPIVESEAQDLLKVHIHRLRHKLEKDPNSPKVIRTVRGHGYMYAFERRSADRPADKSIERESVSASQRERGTSDSALV